MRFGCTLYPKEHFKQEYLCDRRESDILDSSFIRCSLVDYLDLVGLRTSTVDICIALIVQYKNQISNQSFMTLPGRSRNARLRASILRRS